MKRLFRYLLIIGALIILISASPVYGQKLTDQMPHLTRQGDTVQFIVGGKPFTIQRFELYEYE